MPDIHDMKSIHYNSLLRIEDLQNPDFRTILDHMHSLMSVPREKYDVFEHCTDRRSYFERAEIESYKHWEYPWALLRSKPEAGMRVLDCGSGRGMFQIYLALLGCDTYSVDVRRQDANIKRRLFHYYEKLGGRRKSPEQAIINLGRRYGVTLNHRCEPIQQLSFPTDWFDRVYCISVLEHLPAGEDFVAMRQMARVTKPGGYLILTVDFAPIAMDRVAYDERQFLRICHETGFEVVGDTDFSIGDWPDYLHRLHGVFRVSHSVTTAGIVLQKPS